MSNVTIWPLAKIVSPEKIEMGSNIIIDDFVLIIPGTKTVIGDYTHIAAHSSVLGGGELIIHGHCGISSGVQIFTGNEDYLGSCLTNPTVPFPYRTVIRSFVHIGKHTLIGANTVILPGVTIGEGAVIGAGSVVKHDCKPWTVYAGAPARAIKPRRSDMILKLEKEMENESL
jgi:galactoside O-acetyltransferase